MPTEHEHANNLKSAQKRANNPVRAVKQALPNLKLLKYVLLEDFIFVGIAFIFAFLKDLLDYIGIGILAGHRHRYNHNSFHTYSRLHVCRGREQKNARSS